MGIIFILESLGKSLGPFLGGEFLSAIKPLPPSPGKIALSPNCKPAQLKHM